MELSNFKFFFWNHIVFPSLETRTSGFLKSPTRIGARTATEIDLLRFNDFTFSNKKSQKPYPSSCIRRKLQNYGQS